MVLWMSNIVIILRSPGRYEVWIFLALCDDITQGVVPVASGCLHILNYIDDILYFNNDSQIQVTSIAASVNLLRIETDVVV